MKDRNEPDRVDSPLPEPGRFRRSQPVYDDGGRTLRPAFLNSRNDLMIFPGSAGLQRFVERNGYTLIDGIWKSEGLSECRAVVVRAVDDQWVVVPEAEAADLRDRVFSATGGAAWT